MTSSFSLGGASGALFLTLMQLASVEATLSRSWCAALYCRGGGRPVAAGPGGGEWPVLPLTLAWEPYVDNPGRGEGGPRCPAPRARGGDPYPPDLLEAPLPPGYVPVSPSAPELFACVRIGAEGEVAAIRLLGSSGRRKVDKSIVLLARGAWRFASPGEGDKGRWQRVRLSDRPQRVRLSEQPPTFIL
jgi:hypothetical protein